MNLKRSLIIWFLVGIPTMIFLPIFVGGRMSALNYPDWLIGLVISVPILLLVFFLFIRPALTQLTNNTFLGQGSEAKRILSTGKPATATVLRIGENSKGGVLTINDQPVLNIKLLVEASDNKPYEVSVDTLVPRTQVPQFQPGAVFKVRIDPQNPQKVVLAL